MTYLFGTSAFRMAKNGRTERTRGETDRATCVSREQERPAGAV